MDHLPQLLANGLVDGSLYALTALGISLVFAIQRFANVAHSAFMTLSAYAVLASLALGMPIVGAVGVGLVTGAVVAVLSERLAFRALERGPAVTLVVASIGVTLALQHLVALIWGSGVRNYGLPVWVRVDLGLFTITPIGLGTMLVAFLAVGLLLLLLHRTQLGVYMRAVSDLPDLARVCGVPARRVVVATWAIVGVLAALAGIAFGVRTVLTPMLGWDILILGFAAAILGGIGSVSGAVIGGLVLGVGAEVATIWVPSTYREVFAFVVMLVVLLLRPQGIVGARTRV